MALGILTVVLFVLVLWNLLHLPDEADLGAADEKKDKMREHLVLDIRAANQYCLALIALLGVMSLIVANKADVLKEYRDSVHLWPFAVAFVTAGVSVLFIPAGYGQGSFRKLRVLWVRTVVCEQIAVACTIYGIYSAMLVIFRG